MAAKNLDTEVVPARSTQHATFVVERTYDATPAQVFSAWAEPAAKARWFAGSDESKLIKREMYFRVGGRECVVGKWSNDVVTSFESLYQDIVPNQRIVYSYDMHQDEKRISVSLATIEFKPEGAGTRLIISEQGVFLDDYDDAGSREAGTRWLLEKIEVALRKNA